MPILETEEEAEQRMSKRSKSQSSESDKKERVNQRQKDAFGKKVEQLKNGKQEATGLKIMTPNQLLTRLPILLAPKKAGKISQKLNNEIRQITYSLYSSKSLSKKVYNHLMNSI